MLFASLLFLIYAISTTHPTLPFPCTAAFQIHTFSPHLHRRHADSPSLYRICIKARNLMRVKAPSSVTVGEQRLAFAGSQDFSRRGIQFAEQICKMRKEALMAVGGDEEDYKPCPHLLDYRLKHGTRAFRALQNCIRSAPLGKASLRTEGKEVPRCTACGRSYGRLYACLLCAAIGCCVSPGVYHTRAHAQAKPGHDLAVDIDRAELFCCICNDQVYDPDFDSAIICAQSAELFLKNANKLDCGNVTCRGISLLNGLAFREDLEEDRRYKHKKRMRKADFRPWIPTSREQQLLRQGSTPLGDDFSFPLGLRGLNNLGNTCFMNSVLQALLHTPPLRNYFLSDCHNRASCQKQAPRLCLGCDMDAIYSAAYSGDQSPYSPAQFLYSWWRHASNLAGYEQQDAHEFFISTIDGIHANSMRSNESAGDGNCNCIAHRVFLGLLRSDLTCMVCGFTSTTYDPCVDVSLDLEPSITSVKIHPDPCLNNWDSEQFVELSGTNMGFGGSTLLRCLDRFTRPEILGSNEKLHCGNCQIRQESIKQMSVRKLPLVLCFHIKRFEHSLTCKTSRKLDRYMQFPFSLDMAPYLSSSIVRSRHGNRLLCLESDECDTQSPSEFELFAVVTHSGKLDSGHYISFLRLNEQWYKCDDAWITKVSEDTVRASQGYMLYYVQKTLSYRASE